MNEWLDRNWKKVLHAALMDGIRTVCILCLVNILLDNDAQEFLFGKGGFSLKNAFTVLVLYSVISWGGDEK